MVDPAVATLARDISQALERFARGAERSGEPPAEEGAIEAAVPEVSGRRQQAILAVPALATEEGLKTAEVARAISYEVPNTHMTLQALERAGHVEMVEGSKPQRWRLVSRYRATGTMYMAIAAQVLKGEWTTYGDISIALRGDTKAARAIGQMAAKLPTFPNPHRVLKEGGEISPFWVDEQGRGPEHCQKMLEAEGVTFSNGRAEMASRVSWDVLTERLRSSST